MNHRTIVLALAGVLLLLRVGDADAECRSFVAKPRKLGSMDLLLHKRMEKRADGVAIKFGGQGQILSVIKFDDGLEALSDELLQKKLEELAGNLRSATEQRGDKIVTVTPLDAWTVGRRTFLAEAATATYRNYNVTAFEYVGLSRDDECFFMVRFTNAADADDASSLDRYRQHVEQAHQLLLKPEEYMAEETEENGEPPAAESASD